MESRDPSSDILSLYMQESRQNGGGQGLLFSPCPSCPCLLCYNITSGVNDALLTVSSCFDADVGTLSTTRMAMESSRLAAADARAHNVAIIRQQHQQLQQLQSDHTAAKSSIAQLEDHIRIKSMELDGAKAQLQVSRQGFRI